MSEVLLTDATVVAESGNDKTGPMTVTNRSIATCPSTCPFLDPDLWVAKGCYGAGRMWHQVNSNVEVIVTVPVMTGVARDRVLGDVTVPEPGNDEIDWEYIGSVQEWADRDGSMVFGYTHSDVWLQMTGQEWRERYPRYVMNVSCHTVEQVLEARERGWEAVISSDDVVQGQVIGDRRVSQCPATYKDGFQCTDCDQFCTTNDRRVVTWFPLHGVQVRKAQAAVARLGTGK